MEGLTDVLAVGDERESPPTNVIVATVMVFGQHAHTPKILVTGIKKKVITGNKERTMVKGRLSLHRLITPELRRNCLQSVSLCYCVHLFSVTSLIFSFGT